MDYLISIIIPVFKVERYIERCILSVIHQNYLDATVECVIVNDASPDNSMEIANVLISQYQGPITFKVINSKVNEGLSATRNKGINKAKGRYLFFLDSDDYLSDGCMNLFVNQLKKYPGVQMVMGNNLNRSTGETYINPRKIPHGVIANSELLELYYQTYIPVMAWNSMILRELIVKNGLSFRQGILEEDMLWANQLYQYVDFFVFIPQITLVYEYNPDSIINTMKNNYEKYVLSHTIILEGLMSTPFAKHEVSKTLYIASHLLTVLDVVNQHGDMQNENVLGILSVRNQLLRRTINHGRLLLFVFEWLLYPPFNNIVRWKMFRKRYSRLLVVVREIALILGLFHRKK